MRCVLPLEDEATRERIRDRADVAVLGEALVVPRALAGERDVHRVMKVIGPLRVHRITALLDGTEQPRIVQVALGDHLDEAAELERRAFHAFRERLGEMHRAEVVDAVNGVEPKRIHVELAHPVARVLDDEAAHLVAVRAVVVHSRSPRRAIDIREVRPVLGEIISFGTDVVVDDIEHHGEPFAV